MLSYGYHIYYKFFRAWGFSAGKISSVLSLDPSLPVYLLQEQQWGNKGIQETTISSINFTQSYP